MPGRSPAIADRPAGPLQRLSLVHKTLDGHRTLQPLTHIKVSGTTHPADAHGQVTILAWPPQAQRPLLELHCAQKLDSYSSYDLVCVDPDRRGADLRRLDLREGVLHGFDFRGAGPVRLSLNGACSPPEG